MRGRPSVAPASAALPWWATPRGAAIIVALVAAAAFARALGNGFTYDEGLVLVGAQRFLQSGSFGTLLSKGYFTASLEGTWRPFCTLTYMLDAMVSFHPAVFKLDGLMWHIAAAWLLMALCRRLLPEGRRRWAIVAGLLFALHPITAETVDNASFREDSLVTVFTLATLILSLDRRPALALLCYALGLLSKESAVMAPALLAILRLGRFDRETPRTWGPQAPPSPRPFPATVRRLALELVPFGVVTLCLPRPALRPDEHAGRLRPLPGRHVRRHVDRSTGHLGARSAAGHLALAALRRLHRLFPVRRAALGPGAARRGGGAGLPRPHRVRRLARRAGHGARPRLVSPDPAPGLEPAADADPRRRAVPLPAALRDRARRRRRLGQAHGEVSGPGRSPARDRRRARRSWRRWSSS